MYFMLNTLKGYNFVPFIRFILHDYESEINSAVLFSLDKYNITVTPHITFQSFTVIPFRYHLYFFLHPHIKGGGIG